MHQRHARQRRGVLLRLLARLRVLPERLHQPGRAQGPGAYPRGAFDAFRARGSAGRAQPEPRERLAFRARSAGGSPHPQARHSRGVEFQRLRAGGDDRSHARAGGRFFTGFQVLQGDHRRSARGRAGLLSRSARRHPGHVPPDRRARVRRKRHARAGHAGAAPGAAHAGGRNPLDSGDRRAGAAPRHAREPDAAVHAHERHRRQRDGSPPDRAGIRPRARQAVFARAGRLPAGEGGGAARLHPRFSNRREHASLRTPEIREVQTGITRCRAPRRAGRPACFPG